ncbi:MAG: PIG-L deacetylase family protein [Clostridium sp.]
MNKILVIAPHGDDETLGCGGSLLKFKNEGKEIYWCLITSMKIEDGYSEERILEREMEIDKIYKEFGFSKMYKLNFSPSKLDWIPLGSLIDGISKCILDSKADTIFIPSSFDIHTDHKTVFKASISCTKTFRFPLVKRVYVYETLSETEFGMDIEKGAFNPNLFINIEGFIEKKIEACKIYKSEMGSHPFPRSEEGVMAISVYRGLQCGHKNAEAFMVLKEIID